MAIPKIIVAKNPKRESVFINANGHAFDTYDQETKKIIKADNVLSVGRTSREALANYYGKKN